MITFALEAKTTGTGDISWFEWARHAGVGGVEEGEIQSAGKSGDEPVRYANPLIRSFRLTSEADMTLIANSQR